MLKFSALRKEGKLVHKNSKATRPRKEGKLVHKNSKCYVEERE